MLGVIVKIGVIADTHDEFDPGIETALAGVDHILHAGDVCDPAVIVQLESIARVTVVAGNNDFHPTWRSTEVVEFLGHRVLMEHIVHPHRPSREFERKLGRIRPSVVVFGHTHRPFEATIDGVLYLNPGSAGDARHGFPRSVALLHLDEGGMRVESVILG